MLAVLAVLFVLSGAAGLFNEAVWSRYLSWAYEHRRMTDRPGRALSLLCFTNSLGAARAAYELLRSMSGRREGDLRLSLLHSYIESAIPRAP